MNDFRDLKAIAEACQQHQPLRYMRSHGALYIRNDNGIVFDVHQNRSFPEFMAQNKDYADLALAANPETILALIAENERLTTENSEIESAAITYIEDMQEAQHENERLTELFKVGMTLDGNLRVYGDWQSIRKAQEILAERDQLKAENEALRKEREGKVLVPVTPSTGLLMSMAIRSDHALGCPGYYDQKGLGRPNNGVSHARMLECAIGDMRKLHEEVVGSGFYSAEKEADYLAMAKAVQP